MEKKSPEDEIDKLENTVKGVLGKISNIDADERNSVSGQITNLEEAVRGALTELTDLESQIVNIIKPSPSSKENSAHASQEGNFLMAVRRFQNAMNVAIIDGFNKKNLDTFQEGFNFYDNALKMLTSTGNEAEIDQLNSELAQTLIKIVIRARELSDDSLKPFIVKSCQVLAEIYESFNSFQTSLKYHGHVAYILSDNPLLSELEYFQAILDALLLQDITQAQSISGKLKLRNFKQITEKTIQIFQNKNTEGLGGIKKQIQVLGAQRRLNISNTIALLDALGHVIKPEQQSAIETIKIPAEAKSLTNENIAAIKDSLSSGIQKLQSAHPDIQIPTFVPQIDTSSIISEIKSTISAEISKEIKSMSEDIVSKILKTIPVSAPASTPQPRSAGNISDEGMPDIQIVEGSPLDPGEKPKRPKLDDMLDSIIVSE
ncbi:MAG: hypothetical protein ACTSR8_01720 [Promethearchaeota archaeon]